MFLFNGHPDIEICAFSFCIQSNPVFPFSKNNTTLVESGIQDTSVSKLLREYTPNKENNICSCVDTSYFDFIKPTHRLQSVWSIIL